ncbi:hypothetical protein PanWU01x14_020950, partial [Parasponia andersonii]
QRIISLLRSLCASLSLSRGVLAARQRGESPEHQADNVIEQAVGELLMRLVREGNTTAFVVSGQAASSGLGVVVGKVEGCWVSELVSWSVKSSAESME